MSELAEITRLAMTLSLCDRLELAWRLRESVDDNAAREEFETELRRRCDEMESGVDPGIPHEEVMRHLRVRYGDSPESPAIGTN